MKEGNDLLLRHKHFSEELDRVLYEKRGRLSIGFPILRGISLLPVTLPRFSEEFPNVEILCYEEDASTLDRLIQQGELDIGFLTVPLTTKILITRLSAMKKLSFQPLKTILSLPCCKPAWL